MGPNLAVQRTEYLSQERGHANLTMEVVSDIFPLP